jgi:hypothetical protein
MSRWIAAPFQILLDALQERRGEGYVAWHSIFNFYYMVAPKKGSPGAKDFIFTPELSDDWT